MHDANLVDALEGLLHFLFHSYIGVRLVILAASIAIVVYVSKQSHHIAKFLGWTLLAGGGLCTVASAWGFFTSLNFIWLGLIFLGVIAAAAGRGIVDSYGQPPQQSAPQQQMPTPQPLSPYTNVGNVTPDRIGEKWGGRQAQRKLDHQESYD